jgi:hypothetical protein
MNFFRTHILKNISLSLLLFAFVTQSIPMLENELENQRFTQWLNKHFNHSLATNQYPELSDPKRLESIRHHLQELWNESDNLDQWTNAVKAYLKQKNLDQKLLIEWNMLDHMDQHQHMALLQESRVYALNNQAHGKSTKLTGPNYLSEPTTHKTQLGSKTRSSRSSYSVAKIERPLSSGIAIGAP